MKRKFKLRDVIKIEWEDTCSWNGWHRAEDAHTLVRVVSVGMVHSINKDNLTIIQTHDDDLIKVSEALTIPRKNIKKISVLK